MKLFEITEDDIRDRVLVKPRIGEFISLVAVVMVAIYFSVNYANGQDYAVDYEVFIEATNGNYAGFFYAPWILPVFSLFDLLPITISYFIWNILNIAMLWLALRVFGGNVPIALLSYQMFFCLFYGQIVGLLAGALAIFWWAIIAKKYWLAGFMLALASTKPQLGFPIALTLLLLRDISWMDRIKVLAISSIPGIISLIVYPTFLVDVYETAQTVPPNTIGSVSLWRYIGAFSLLLWIPTLFLPLTKGRRLVAVLTTVALSLPYFQQTDLLMLYALPVGWVGLLGNMGYLMGVIGWLALPMLVAVPALTYILVFVTHFWEQYRGKPKRLATV